MFKTRFLMLLLILVLALPTLATYAQDGEEEPVCEGLLFLNAWSRPSPANIANGAMYFIIVNFGEEDDTLIGGTTEFANALEVHEMFMLDDGTMRMQPVAGGLVIPAGGYAELRPGGYHVMLIGVTQDLVEGEPVTATLEFEKAGTVDISGLVGFEAPMEPSLLATGDISGCPAFNLYGGRTYHTADHMDIEGLLLNLSNSDVVITGISTDVAETAHFAALAEATSMNHSDSTATGFQQLEHLHLAPRSFVILKHDGVHIAMHDMLQSLMMGDIFDITFSFEEGDDLTVSVAFQPEMEMHNGMEMHGTDDHEMDSTPEAHDGGH